MGTSEGEPVSAGRPSYTPGPWAICKDSPNQICPAGGGLPVARVDLTWGAVAAANARLIVAAPELVDALGAMLEQFSGRGGPVIRQARAVLAKARGESIPEDTNMGRDPEC